MTRMRFSITGVMCVCFAMSLRVCSAASPKFSSLALSTMHVKYGIQQWGEPHALNGDNFVVAGQTFATGVATAASSRVTVRLYGGAHVLTGSAAIDDHAAANASAVFSIWSGKTRLWTSAIMHRGDVPVSFSLNVSRAHEVTLKADRHDGNAFNCRCDWLNTTFTYHGRPPFIVDHPANWRNQFVPGAVWRDTNGVPIQAHGGGLLYYHGTWYWVGEDKSQGYNNTVGVHEYSSRDLVHWNDEGVVLPAASLPEEFRSKGVCERPKIVYNRLSNVFLMWMHLDAHRYAVARAGIATATKPAGPYRYVTSMRPINNSTFRDMNLFVDTDGGGYVIYAAENNATLYIVRLDSTYGAPRVPEMEGTTWARIAAGGYHEAPVIWHYGPVYYLLASHTSGWYPNAASLFTASTPLGPWTYRGNPFIGADSELTFYTQSTCVIPAPGHPGWFVYMGDRWNPQDLGNSRYVWLPFHINKGSDSFSIAWRSHWSLGGLDKQLKP